MSLLAKHVAAALLLLGPVMTFGAATDNDFPTIDRVLFVENCIRDYPDHPHQEMLYKCSCAVDAIAGQFRYDEYVELATAVDAGQVAGKRGAAVRESSEGKNMTKRFREARAKAYSSCFIQ
jgi:hypothetical protein